MQCVHCLAVRRADLLECRNDYVDAQMLVIVDHLFRELLERPYEEAVLYEFLERD